MAKSEDMRLRARGWLEAHYGKSLNAGRHNVSAHTFEEDEVALASLLSDVRERALLDATGATQSACTCHGAVRALLGR